jgi:hypothetical protein
VCDVGATSAEGREHYKVTGNPAYFAATDNDRHMHIAAAAAVEGSVCHSLSPAGLLALHLLQHDLYLLAALLALLALLVHGILQSLTGAETQAPETQKAAAAKLQQQM